MTRHTLTWMALFGATALALPGLAAAAEPATEKDGLLVDQHNMPLYTYAKDDIDNGKSVCNDKCAANWPPLKAAAGDAEDGEWTIIKRDDGSMQWAYKGSPLYTFKADSPGKATGDGKADNAWKVVKVDSD
jgi:predicted lipoprotein with Yx(FWY)xxD motif